MLGGAFAFPCDGYGDWFPQCRSGELFRRQYASRTQELQNLSLTYSRHSVHGHCIDTLNYYGVAFATVLQRVSGGTQNTAYVVPHVLCPVKHVNSKSILHVQQQFLPRRVSQVCVACTCHTLALLLAPVNPSTRVSLLPCLICPFSW